MGCRRAGRSTGSLAVPLAVRAVAGVPGDDAGGGAAIVHDRRAEVVGTVRDNAQEASRMRGSGISTAQEAGHTSGHSKARSSSLGEAIDQPVGPPVDGSEEFAIARCDLWAGIHTNLPLWTMDARSSPTTCAILAHTLASGLSW